MVTLVAIIAGFLRFDHHVKFGIKIDVVAMLKLNHRLKYHLLYYNLIIISIRVSNSVYYVTLS